MELLADLNQARDLRPFPGLQEVEDVGNELDQVDGLRKVQLVAEKLRRDLGLNTRKFNPVVLLAEPSLFGTAELLVSGEVLKQGLEGPVLLALGNACTRGGGHLVYE